MQNDISVKAKETIMAIVIRRGTTANLSEKDMQDVYREAIEEAKKIVELKKDIPEVPLRRRHSFP